MARIKKELTELIGGTPLLELSRLSKKHDAKAQIIAKLEYFNAGLKVILPIRRFGEYVNISETWIKCKRPYSPGNDRGCRSQRNLETRSGYH